MPERAVLIRIPKSRHAALYVTCIVNDFVIGPMVYPFGSKEEALSTF